MDLTSNAFEHRGEIPLKYTKDGENISPPLRWSDLPEETKELVLVLENVTPHTKEPFVQWLVYKVPPDMENLPEGFKHKRDPEEPADVLQGRNSLNNVGYDGPQGAASRTFHYVFRLYALDEPLDVPAGLDKEALLDTMTDHIIEEVELAARFERPLQHG